MEQVQVTRQNPPSAKKAHPAGHSRTAARTSGTTTSGVLQVTHTQCTAQDTVARETRTHGAAVLLSWLTQAHSESSPGPPRLA